MHLVIFLLYLMQQISAFISTSPKSITSIKLGLPNMPMDPPHETSPSRALYDLIQTNRIANASRDTSEAIPLAGIYDALSAKIFAQRGAPAIFLSGFGVSASLLGVPGENVFNNMALIIFVERA